METLDFTRSHRALYTATDRVKPVEAGTASFLAVEGEGPPGQPAHEAAIHRLFELVWAAKLALEYGGILDFKVPPLECLWLSDPTIAPHAPWRWRLMMRLPDAVTEAQLAGPRRYVEARKGFDTAEIRRRTFTEGHAVQTLHTGPYGEEAGAYARLDAYAGERGLTLSGVGHDIYLSDPDRVAAERLRTIIRLQVSTKRPLVE